MFSHPLSTCSSVSGEFKRSQRCESTAEGAATGSGGGVGEAEEASCLGLGPGRM